MSDDAMAEREAPAGTRWIRMPSRRQLLVGGALLATAGVAYARTPRVKEAVIGKDEIEASVPMTIGSWRYETKSGLVLPPPDEYAAQFYDQTLTRTYVSDTELPIMLLIAYGSSQSGMLQVHRPETCYPAGGFQLSETVSTEAPVPGGAIPSRFFTAVSADGDRIEQLLYYIRIGSRFPQVWLEQRMAVFRDNIDGLIPDGLLVRVSTITGDRITAEATIKRFTSAMVAAASDKGKLLLLGPSRRPPTLA